MATRDNVIRLRVNDEEKSKLRQLQERFEASGMSELIRDMIDMVYLYPDVFEYYLEKEEK